MAKYVLRKAVSLVATMFILSICVFFIIHLIPGDPARIMLGEKATPEMVQIITEKYGLDKPIWNQYLIWLGGIFRGDLGTSLRTQQPVVSEIASHYGKTVKLAVMAMTWSVIAGLLLGIWSATHCQKWQDYTGITVSVVGQAMPNFWLGLILIYFLCVKLRLFPILPDGSFKSLILPAFTLGSAMMSTVARFMRSSIIESLKEDYTRTARAKGLLERTIIYKHVLRNSVIPVITIIGMQFGVMLGGAVVVESVFGYSGIGLLLVDSITHRDYTTLQMLILLISLHYVVINMVIDVLYAVVDPEIRLQ